MVNVTVSHDLLFQSPGDREDDHGTGIKYLEARTFDRLREVDGV